METFSALLALCAGNSPVTGEFPTQRPVTRSFDIFFDLHQNKRLRLVIWDAISPIMTSLLITRHCYVGVIFFFFSIYTLNPTSVFSSLLLAHAEIRDNITSNNLVHRLSLAMWHTVYWNEKLNSRVHPSTYSPTTYAGWPIFQQVLSSRHNFWPDLDGLEGIRSLMSTLGLVAVVS